MIFEQKGVRKSVGRAAKTANRFRMAQKSRSRATRMESPT